MMNDYSAVIMEGFWNNILIMLLSSIAPAMIGIGLTFLVGYVKKKPLRLSLRIVGAVFYSLAPVALMMVLFFNVFTSSTGGILPAVLAVSISHLGLYMLCYDASASISKNIVVNSLGMLTSAFLWSTMIGYIGGKDIVHAFNMIRTYTYDSSPLFTMLLICFVILVLLNVPRMILKEVMK